MIVGGLILARMDSRRLPGKGMLSLSGQPMIEYIIDQFQNIEGIEPIIVTTDREIDFPLIDSARKKNIKFHAGELDDVAARIIGATKKFNLDYFQRINGDSPFVDVDLVQKGLSVLKEDSYEMVSNIIDRTYPYGVSLELFRTDTFIKSYNNFHKPEHFEHVSMYFYENLAEFKHYSVSLGQNFSDFQLTIDTIDDYVYIARLLSAHPDFNKLNLNDKIQLLKNNKFQENQ